MPFLSLLYTNRNQYYFFEQLNFPMIHPFYSYHYWRQGRYEDATGLDNGDIALDLDEDGVDAGDGQEAEESFVFPLIKE